MLLNSLLLRKSVNLSFSYRSLKKICWKGSPIYLPFIFLFLFPGFITYHVQTLLTRADEPLIWPGAAILLVCCSSPGYWITGIHSGFYHLCLQIFILQCKIKGSKLIPINFKNWEEWIIRVSITMEYGSSCCVINSESAQFLQTIWPMLPEWDAALTKTRNCYKHCIWCSELNKHKCPDIVQYANS